MRKILFEYIHEFQALTSIKLMMILGVSMTLTNVMNFINIYIFNDWDFLIWLGLLIAIDTIVGIIRSVKEKIFNPTSLGKVFFKIVLYALSLITVHILIYFKVNGEHPSLMNWIDQVFFSAMMSREGWSIFKHIALIYPDFFPKWILKRFEEFDENGTIPTLNER